MNLEVAICGICKVSDNHPECCVCLMHLCESGSRIKDLCHRCAETVNGVHPLTRMPLPKCTCGKVWNNECSRKSFFGNKEKIYIGPDPFKHTVPENIANHNNPLYWKTSDEQHMIVRTL